MSTNINNNQLKDSIDNYLKFDGRNSLDNNPANDPLPVVNISLKESKKYTQKLN